VVRHQWSERPPTSLTTANGSRSSSAQNPDAVPPLEGSGLRPDQFHTTPLNTRCPI